MNKFHVIGPLLLTAAFVPCYVHFSRAHDEQTAAARAVAEQHRIDDELLRDQRERDAIESARQAQIARDSAVVEKERLRRADLAAKNEITLDQLNVATSTAENDARVNETLRARLEELRATRLSAEREAFALSRDLELQQIDRRNIDLRLQQKMQFVTSRMEVSPLLEGSLFQNADPYVARAPRADVH